MKLLSIGNRDKWQTKCHESGCLCTAGRDMLEDWLVGSAWPDAVIRQAEE